MKLDRNKSINYSDTNNKRMKSLREILTSMPSTGSRDLFSNLMIIIKKPTIHITYIYKSHFPQGYDWSGASLDALNGDSNWIECKTAQVLVVVVEAARSIS